jgi:hypothetical protein
MLSDTDSVLLTPAPSGDWVRTLGYHPLWVAFLNRAAAQEELAFRIGVEYPLTKTQRRISCVVLVICLRRSDCTNAAVKVSNYVC